MRNDVQTNILNDTTALIEYHWSAEDTLYIFTLTKNNIYTKKVSIERQFHRHTKQFIKALKNSSSEPDDFIPSGYEIYQTVFAPIHHHLHKNIKKIILLPDGKLNYIPFEALTTTIKNNWDSLSYLIDDFTFNYLYSCSNYKNPIITDSIHTALYIEPTFNEKNNLPSLGENQISEQIDYPKTIELIKKEPDYNRVIKEIPKADMIHFHTHAEQGTKGSGKIHLYAGDVINQNEIQSLPLKARHVVLSACETGTGELSRGEGVLSLGWSFVYRGVPSVVMSLWKVSNTSTNELMQYYYEEIGTKAPADVALKNAKIRLRQQGKHPYHWASFIHTGNPPTKQSNNQNYRKYLYILGTLLLLLVLIYRTRKITDKQKNPKNETSLL